MKKLLALLICLLPLLAFSQQVTQQNKVPSSGASAGNQYFGWYGGIFNGYLIFPIGTNAVINRQTGIEGQVYLQTSDSTLQVFHSGHFIPFGGKGGGSGSNLYLNGLQFKNNGSTPSLPVSLQTDTQKSARIYYLGFDPATKALRYDTTQFGSGGVTSFNTRHGVVTLLSSDVTTALGFTPENVANKATTFGTLNNTLYPTTQAVANYAEALTNKTATSSTSTTTYPNWLGVENYAQPILVSGTNIKTVNGNSLLGSGNLVISGGGGTQATLYTTDSLLSSNRHVGNNGHYLNIDSLYLNSPPAYTSPSGKNINFVGTSITLGNGASPIYERYSSQTAFQSGFTQVNIGRTGTTLGNPAVSGSLVTNLSVIPTKGTNDKWLIFEYLANDIEQGFSYPSTTYATDLQTCLNYATAHGWSNSQIVVGTSFYIDATINHKTMTIPQFQARIDSFNTAVRTVVAANSGMHLVDWDKVITSNNQGQYLTADGTHPNNAGHLLGAQALIDVIFNTVTRKGQALAVKGLADIDSIRMNTYNFSTDTNNRIIVRDTLGFLHATGVLPNNIRTQGYLYLTGRLVDPLATIPTGGLGANDYLLRQDAKIWSTVNGVAADANSITVANSGSQMIFASKYSLGEFQFNTTSSGFNALIIKPNRSIWVGDGTNDGSFAGNGDVVVGLNSKLFASTGGAVGSFEPYVSGATNIKNSVGGGSINFYSSGGSTGSFQKNLTMWAQGEMSLQKSLSVSRDATAFFSMYSTTQGFLPPSMTTTQKNAISSPTEGLQLYDNVLHDLSYYNGTSWINLGNPLNNPMTTTGDVIYSSSGSTPARLGIGSTNQVLTVIAGIPSWQTPAASGVTSVAAGLGMNFSTITSTGSVALDTTYAVYTSNPRLTSSSTVSYLWTATDTHGHGSWQAAGGGSSVSSVSNSDGTLTISPTTGAVVASLPLSHGYVFTTAQGTTISGLGATTAAGYTLLAGDVATLNNQKWSPALYLTGNQWQTGSTNASEPATFRQFVVPIQNANLGYGAWHLQSNFTNTFTDVVTVTGDGNMTISGNFTGGGVSTSNLAATNTATITSGDINIATAGKRLKVAEGTNGFAGQTTLVSGTKAITITGVTTGSRAIVTLVSQGGTVTTTVAYAAVCTSNTLTITALTNAGTTDTTDTSILNYFIVN